MTETGSIIRRSLFLVILIALAAFNVFGSFQGIDTIQGMEQAQIAREISRGHDFHTKMIRPAAIWQYEREGDRSIELASVRDTYHAPLNPLLLGAVLKSVNGDDADKWQMKEKEHVYGLDRVIAATSALFFLMAIGVTYLLIGRIFDSKIAGAISILLMLCNLMWEFSKSGLPQMLMLLLFCCATLFLFQAIENRNQEKGHTGGAILAGLFLILLCLTHWLAVWIFIGYLIFASVYFRPRGLLALILLGLFALFAAYPLYKNYEASGTAFGTGFLTLYDGLGSTGSEDAIMRDDNLANQQLDLRGLIKKIAIQTLSQLNNLYTYLGAIIVAPIFFLSLFHSFRRKSIGDFRWAILLMWVMGSIGMAIFGLSENTRDSNQLHILFTPVMSAYGLAFLVIIWSRLKLGEGMESLKYTPHILAILLSSGPMLLDLPSQIKFGTSTSIEGVPHWPPYYPYGLNSEIPKLTKSNEIIVTDQPWAVAWYADRTALWLPRSLKGFDRYELEASQQKTPFAGILISPYSHSLHKLRNVKSEYKEFLPLVFDGLSRQSSDNKISSFATSTNLKDLSNRYKYLNPLVGTDMIFYASNPPR